MAIPDKKLKEVCKFGKGGETCSYLAMDSDGFRCLKGTELKKPIAVRKAAGMMKALGDNCNGHLEN